MAALPLRSLYRAYVTYTLPKGWPSCAMASFNLQTRSWWMREASPMSRLLTLFPAQHSVLSVEQSSMYWCVFVGGLCNSSQPLGTVPTQDSCCHAHQ